MTVYRNTIPNEILANNDLLFHGTSNISEQYFDTGVYGEQSHFSQDEINDVKAIYERLNWKGDHHGGFAVLNSFSQVDFINSKARFLFLGETPFRCATFATRDFAGGELVRALHYSIEDLYKYYQDPLLQNKHREWLEREAEYNYRSYAIDLDFLINSIPLLTDLQKKVEATRNSYRYGIIYCYQIKPDHYSKLRHRGCMGIIMNEKLDNIITAKIVLENPEELISKRFWNFGRDTYTLWEQRLPKA